MDASKKKPGLEEAIHPEIGNDSAWSQDAHGFNLRTVDPLKSLDDRILDDNALEAIQDKWNRNIHGHAPSAESTLSEPLEKEKAASPETGNETQDPEADPIETKVEFSGPSDETATEKATKPGKRIRKVADKAKKDEARKKEERIKSRQLKESSLSDFTSWLKGLTGSEYVHPYEDDYAIHQGLEAREEGISETFADLLATQGYKDQAIAMYTRLIEKFPEKSSFFAAKIEALQS